MRPLSPPPPGRYAGGVRRTTDIELPGLDPIPIIYEDRSVLVIDKPAGWLVVPPTWQRTGRNLLAALLSSIGAGDYWARSRGLKFLRFVHRLDAETTGLLLFVKSPGAIAPFSELFESRRVEKTYLAVVRPLPGRSRWTCRLALSPARGRPGRMRVDTRQGKPAETQFRLLHSQGGLGLVEARPQTGRTHQIRVHLAAGGCPVLGDTLYGQGADSRGLALRAVRLAYADPFTRRPVEIRAPIEEFCGRYGFDAPAI